jgi:predicted GNAT family acetyltransferase
MSRLHAELQAHAPKGTIITRRFLDDDRIVSYLVQSELAPRLEVAAGFTLGVMPGNAQILVSSDAWVAECLRKRGLGRALNQTRVDGARAAGFKVLMATVRKDNWTQIKIMEKNGWTWVHQISPTASLWLIRLDRS